MKDLVEYIVRSLVEHPDDVRVREYEGENGVVVELRVHPDDLGVVIGRRGRTAMALRSVVAVAASRAQKQVSLEILD